MTGFLAAIADGWWFVGREGISRAFLPLDDNLMPQDLIAVEFFNNPIDFLWLFELYKCKTGISIDFSLGLYFLNFISSLENSSYLFLIVLQRLLSIQIGNVELGAEIVLFHFLGVGFGLLFWSFDFFSRTGALSFAGWAMFMFIIGSFSEWAWSRAIRRHMIWM